MQEVNLGFTKDQEAGKNFESFFFWIPRFSYMIFYSWFYVIYFTISIVSCLLLQHVIIEFLFSQFHPKTPLDSLDPLFFPEGTI